MKLRADRLEGREVDGELVVLDLGASRYLSVNAAGAAMWPLLLEGTDRGALEAALAERFGIDEARVPTTFPTRGNLGPASVPFTLACKQDALDEGDRVLLMGVGSGLTTACLEIAW